MTGSFPANASEPLKPIGAAARWSRNVFAYQKSCAVENSRFAVRSVSDHEQRGPGAPQKSSRGV